MDKLSRTRSATQARRNMYCDGRRRGLDMWDAALAAGMEEPSTVRRYERWFRAIESGQEILIRGELRGRGTE